MAKKKTQAERIDTIGEAIRKLREQKRMSQKEVAAAIEVDPTQYNRIELGKSLPTPLEWHTAARWDGSSPRAYPWGGKWDVANVAFLDGRPLRQTIDPLTRDVSAFGAKACFSGAREWAIGADTGSTSGCLMGPCVMDLLKFIGSQTHEDGASSSPQVYSSRFTQALAPDGVSAIEADDASLRCVVRLVSDN